MPKHLEGTDFVSVRCYAQNIANAANAAYWSDCTSDKYFLETHRGTIQEALAHLCEFLGLRLVDAEEAPAPLVTEETA